MSENRIFVIFVCALHCARWECSQGTAAHLQATPNTLQWDWERRSRILKRCWCSAAIQSWYNTMRSYKEVSGPGPSGVKSHTGSANAATAPSPASRNTFGLIQTNNFLLLREILLVSFRQILLVSFRQILSSCFKKYFLPPSEKYFSPASRNTFSSFGQILSPASRNT